MLEKYIELPYIIFPFGTAKPSLIITIMYIIVLTILLTYGKRNNLLKLKLISWSQLKSGEKNKRFLSVIGYVIFILSCINLPLLLNEDNTILSISKTYLQYEILLFLGVFLFLCTAFLNTSNRETHITACNRILQYLIWISLGTNLLVGQIDYTFWQNIIVMTCAGLLNIGFLLFIVESVDTKQVKTDRFDLIPYSSVHTLKDLFPKHKEQAEDIAGVIFNSSDEPLSICLSGKWGTGKTSVINGVVDILKNREDYSYEFIYINALELDNKQTVLYYLMTQIKNKLKSRSAYVGIDSEYKEFVSSTAGVLTSSAIGTFIQKKVSDGDDYRQQKQQLEAVLKRAFKNDKLIVIVDDIERCDTKIAREYLFLIKEITTMKNCVSIFVTDYDILNKVVSNENAATNSSDFLNKFFNYKIDLYDENPKDIFSFYDTFFTEEDPAFMSIYRIICKSPGTCYNDIVSGLNLKIEKYRQEKETIHLSIYNEKYLDEKIQQIEELQTLFNELTINSRNIVKFYNVFRNNAHYCAQKLFSSSPKNEVTQYINSRNIGQILFVLSFVEVFMPYEHKQLIKHGARYAERPLYGENTDISLDRKLLIELTQGLVFGAYYSFQEPSGYIIQDIRKFIETFLYDKKELRQLINTYTTIEEEWLNAINELNEPIIKSHWNEMVLMILQKVPSNATGITNEWRNQMFVNLLEFAEKQVELGEWTTDKIFSIFEKDTDRYLSAGTGLIKKFCEHLYDSTVYSKPSKKIVNELLIFSHNYAHTRSSSTYKLAHYLIPINSSINNETRVLQEKFLNSNKPYTENLSEFLNGLEQVVPDFSFTSDGWYANFKEMVEYIDKYLESTDIAKYSDVKEDILHMKDSADEFFALEKIIAWVQGDNSTIMKSSFSGINSDNLGETIDYFKNVFNNQDTNEKNQNDIDKQFANFFKQLQTTQNLIVTEQQINSLHDLISIFVESSGYSSLPYRRTLIMLSESINKCKKDD